MVDTKEVGPVFLLQVSSQAISLAIMRCVEEQTRDPQRAIVHRTFE